MVTMINEFILVVILLISFASSAQKKWTGMLSGNWQDAQNWQPQGVPLSTDDIVFDNGYQKNSYSVSLPDTTVSVHTLLIEATAGNNIEVFIPVSNKGSPALIVNDPGNSFNIKNGGIFRNASGLSSGQSIQLNGLLSIYNGGRYVHNSRSSHATDIVSHLSVANGMEKGVFEFDVPGGSYPISISNRMYGTLVLSSGASGNVQTYNASGSNQAVLDGDFVINEGVQFNLDLTKDFFINNDYIQKAGSVFNVSSGPDNNSIKIKGDFSQSVSGVITETSTGLPAIEFCGDRKQLVSVAGIILNSITMRINNQQGVALLKPLTLPYKLELLSGVVTSDKTNLLVLADNCIVIGGSANSFINGPMKKVGDDDFDFPVGKQGDYAPLKITGTGGLVTDEFIAEYFLGSPEIVYGYRYDSASLVRISKLEYWVAERSSGASVKRVGVYVGNYSNATTLKDLVLVRWDAVANQWKNEGNSFYSGVATGTLISKDLASFGAFTLGSTVMMQNPLVVKSRDVVSPVEIVPARIATTVYLRVKSEKNEQVKVVISDISGRQVKVIKLQLMKGVNNIPVQCESLARGIYFFSLYNSLNRLVKIQEVFKM